MSDKENTETNTSDDSAFTSRLKEISEYELEEGKAGYTKAQIDQICIDDARFVKRLQREHEMKELDTEPTDTEQGSDGE